MDDEQKTIVESPPDYRMAGIDPDVTEALLRRDGILSAIQEGVPLWKIEEQMDLGDNQ